MAKLWNYSGVAGKPAKVTVEWPSTSRLKPPQATPSLVMIVHPECPCSTASVEELNRIIGKFPNLSAQVLFYRPSSFPPKWEQGSLWHSAQRIPGVVAVTDIDGEEARKFGAETSGQTLLYSAQADLVFSGGITPARGHSGDNDGEKIILDYLRDGTLRHASAPVFGCSILDRRAQHSNKDNINAGT